ncbi:LysR family transcriptional regulator [Klebsiella pneumoniae subsp. pneumoniae]|nr:LysR family transcriptional regulator [Klebsiella pneumoniae subsp. pneumoniae]
MHRAAERLHIAQPALSQQQIEQPEQRLGVVLFSRANRQVDSDRRRGRPFTQDAAGAGKPADQAVLDAQRIARASREACIGGMSPARCTTVTAGRPCAGCAPTGRGLSCRWCRGCANALRSAVGSASGYRHHLRAAGPLAAGRAGGQAVCT